MEPTLILVLTALLSATNGANDNGKGVATLAGAGVASYRTALWWGHWSTLLGSLLSGLVATRLMSLFSSGIVSMQPTPAFTVAVLLGAAGWIGVATVARLPVSTTHGIVGALVGAGLVAGPDNVDMQALASRVAAPLLLSVGAGYVLSAVFNRLFQSSAECTCIGIEALDAQVVTIPQFQLRQGRTDDCRKHGSYLALHVDHLHWLTSALAGFARGLNDTPKIAGIALFTVGAAGLPPGLLIAVVAAAMFVGGVWGSHRVTKRLGDDVIQMNHREGALANLSTSLLVILGANLGWPMSTTHVSTGAIVGVARTNTSRLNRKMLAQFLLAWTLTPLTAALLAAAAFQLSAVVLGRF
jgi:PiT family inorganic phosphate transporter